MWDAVIRPIREHLPLWLMLLPLLSAVFVGIAKPFGMDALRRTMLVHWLLSGMLSVWLVVAYEPLKPASSPQQAALLGPLERFQFRDSFAWLGETRSTLLEQVTRLGERRVIEVPVQWGPDIRFAVGVDGISVWFVALSVLLVAVGSGVRGQKSEVSEPVQAKADGREPMAVIPTSPLIWLWLQSSLVGTFIALDVMLFVICWMSTLFSVAVLLGRGGDSLRHDATPRLLKVSWFGGCLVALGLSGLVLAFGWLRPSLEQMETPLVFSIPELIAGIGQLSVAGRSASLWGAINPWLFWLLVVGFAWPMGLAPLHRAFVDSFASAPRGVALVMAGVFVKVGVYGWLRFVVPVFPDLLNQYSESFTTFAGLSTLFAAAVAFGERDWPRRIAFATCSSVGLSLIGMMTLTLEGLTGGVLRVMSHGLTAGLLVWLLPSRMGTLVRPALDQNEKKDRQECPSYRRWLVRFALFAWIGFPGLSGFLPEFVTPFGLFQHAFNAAALSLVTSGLMTWMWVRAERDPPDWSRECWTRQDVCVAIMLVTLNIALGVAPQFVVNRVQPSLLSLLPVDRDTPASEVR